MYSISPEEFLRQFSASITALIQSGCPQLPTVLSARLSHLSPEPFPAEKRTRERSTVCCKLRRPAVSARCNEFERYEWSRCARRELRRDFDRRSVEIDAALIDETRPFFRTI